MKIENIAIDKIGAYPKNAKVHSKKQIQQVANSIKRFGFVQPIVVDKNNEIVIGHCRYEASKLLDLKEVPCLKVENLSDKEISALRLADNKLNESDWDMNLVIDDLKGLDLDLLDLTGFDKDLLIEPDEKDDIVPENVPSRSKLGDLYELGSHRVLCGASTHPDAVLRLMDGKKADISFTSPPYNVGHNIGYEGKESKYIHSDDKIDYQDLIVKTTQNSLENAKDVFVNLQFLANNKKQLLLWLAELADNFKDIFFWKKLQVQPAMAENVANSQVEVIVLFGKENNSRSWGNKKWRGNFSNSIETKSASGENKNAKVHNATFPVELPLTFLKQSYNEGSVVLDLFAGTGTTMIACEKMGMKCFMVDIEPTYVDICVQRYVDYTGIEEVKKNGIIEIWKQTPKIKKIH
jgi:DNA modification methylase